MRKICAVLFFAAMASGASAARPMLPAPQADRVREIAGMLGEKPSGVGRGISDRAAWDGLLRENGGLRQVIEKASSDSGKPLPDLPEALFMEFLKSGSRKPYEKPYFERLGRIGTLALAECLENQGRFLKPLEDAIRAVCTQRTWTLPSVDKKLTDYRGETITLELRSVDIGWGLVTILRVFGDRLSGETRELMRDRVRKWVVEPHLANIRGEREPEWWYTGTNNWNAVCLAGTTGAALGFLESREDRALCIAAAELHIQSFLSGFTSDGYCSEGIGYWNYGFGHFIALAETIYQATGGKVDLFGREGVAAAARFPLGIEILDGVYPAIADCSIDAAPSKRLVHFLSRRFQWGLRDYEAVPMAGNDTYFSLSCLFSFPNSATASAPSATDAPSLPMRSWFDQAGILVSRPAAGSKSRFAVALKGGHNKEHHNHNDVGTFVVVSGGEALILDAGGEPYTARTFSARRYESQVLNSYGHSVPLVGGKMQSEGRQAAAKILATEFSDTADRIVMDLSSCYALPELRALKRTFVYDRTGAGALDVIDEVEFSKPCDFGTAFITVSRHRMTDEGGFVVQGQDGGVRVTVRAEEGGGTGWKVETMRDGKKPTRIGVNFAEPVVRARLVSRIEPLAQASAGGYVEADMTGLELDMAGAVTVEAEAFVGEEGGQVEVCPKVGASGTAFKLWRDAGHALSWRVAVPRAGRYAFLLRQCQNHKTISQFRLQIDGQPAGVDEGSFAMPTTGGWSGESDDWRECWIGQNGKPLLADLAAGEHTFRIENANGAGVNLDWIRLTPVKAGK